MTFLHGHGDNFMVIDIDTLGGIEAMHRENVLPLLDLGRAKVSRASDLVFNEQTQQFDIHLATVDGFAQPVPEATGFPSYEAARDMEVRWLEMARLHDVQPASDEGRILLSALRGALVH
jgi:hypothetical protein